MFSLSCSERSTSGARHRLFQGCTFSSTKQHLVGVTKHSGAPQHTPSSGGEYKNKESFSAARTQIHLHRQAVLNHLISLWFRINWPKSCVVPMQCVEYLGLKLNSLSCHVTLSERIISLLRARCIFRLGKVVPFRLCLRILSRIASVISVVQLGLLMMRDFQRWATSL